MFHSFVSAPNEPRPHVSRTPALALLAGATLAAVTTFGLPAAALAIEPPQAQSKRAEPTKDAVPGDGEAERKLLTDLNEAIDAQADHLDPSRVDRDLAAAFTRFGLDLDVVYPKAAVARLAGKPSTPEIAAAIDDWCRLRRRSLKVPTWRKLQAVARAVDPDPWRNTLRDQAERASADAVPALCERASDAPALKKQPAKSLLLLAEMLYDADDNRTAAAVLRVARERYPRDFWICWMQGNLQVGRPARSEPSAESCYAAAAALRPKSPLAHLYLAVALHDQKKSDQAAAELREGTRLAPDTADAHRALGYALAELDKLDEAVSRFRRAIQLNPADANSQWRLGGALSEQGKMDEAIAALREAIKLDPNSGRILIYLGYTLQRQGKLDEATALFRQAIRLAPRSARAHYLLGSALTLRKKLVEAIPEFRAAIQLDPEDAASQLGLGYALTETGKLDDAIAACRQAIRIKPDEPDAHSYLASALLRSGKVDEAITALGESLRLKRKTTLPDLNRPRRYAWRHPASLTVIAAPPPGPSESNPTYSRLIPTSAAYYRNQDGSTRRSPLFAKPSG